MHDAFKTAGPTCISFSGGRTSAYLLWRVLQAHGGKLPEEAQVLFCNTGKEEEATLRFVRDCGQRWGVDIVWLEYTGSGEWVQCDFGSAARNGEPFEAVIVQRGGNLPNRMARYCSSELKTRTMHRYLRWGGWTEWDTFIGIRADEPRRVAKFRANPHPETKAETVDMPLVWGRRGSRRGGRVLESAALRLGVAKQRRQDDARELRPVLFEARSTGAEPDCREARPRCVVGETGSAGIVCRDRLERFTVPR